MAMTLRIAFVFGCLLFFVRATRVDALASVHGTVSHRVSGCEYFLVQTGSGYDLLEWYGGYDPDKGDTIVGNFETYGFHDVIDEAADESIHVYTNSYWLSKSNALEKLLDKCE